MSTLAARAYRHTLVLSVMMYVTGTARLFLCSRKLDELKKLVDLIEPFENDGYFPYVGTERSILRQLERLIKDEAGFLYFSDPRRAKTLDERWQRWSDDVSRHLYVFPRELATVKAIVRTLHETRIETTELSRRLIGVMFGDMSSAIFDDDDMLAYVRAAAISLEMLQFAVGNDVPLAPLLGGSS